MNDYKKYIRDLNIVKNNLIKFYYNSASEWLKPEILNCITAIKLELELYTRRKEEKENYFKQNQTTIFNFISSRC